MSDLRSLSIITDKKPRLDTYLCKLDIVVIELLLHDLLQYAQSELMRFQEAHLLFMVSIYT